MTARDWASAWADALYGPAGFYVAGPGAATGPGEHFRTSVHVGAVFHRALARLITEVDDRLDRPAVLDVLDVGSGRGELLSGVLAALPPPVASRVRPVAVEVRSRPAHLDPRIEWVADPAPQSLSRAYPTGVDGVLLCHEWLDNLPCDVVEVDRHGVVRLVLVKTDGTESLGPALRDEAGCRDYGVDGPRARQWMARWWPVTLPGARAEVGLTRDLAWAQLSATLRRGTALAVDYGHVRGSRYDGRFDAGTLVGYTGGRQGPPVPDGQVDITAHVAMDACAAATSNPGRHADSATEDEVTLTRQRDSLSALGVCGRLPAAALAADPAAYAAALDVASQSAELRDPAGLGGFWWLRLDRSRPTERIDTRPGAPMAPRDDRR